MISISTDAKMQLMDNQKVLFKADVALSNGESADGKNLAEHENDLSVSVGSDYSQGYFLNGDKNVGTISNIPISLFWNYRYAIVSMDIKFTEMSVINRFYLGFRFKRPNGTTTYYLVPSLFQNVVVSDEFARYTFVWDKATWGRTASDQIVQLVDINIRFENACAFSMECKNAMYELSDTGVSSEYANSYITNGGTYADIGYVTITGDDVMGSTVSLSDNVSSSSSFDIGSAIINSMSLSLNNYDDRFSLYDFTGAKIKPYIGIPLETTEWIEKGYFTVDKPTSLGSTIPMNCLDNMSKFRKPYKDVTQTYPATLGAILTTICIYCGVVQESATFDNSTLSIPTRPDDENLSCLDMVSYIAQIAGCFARVNRFGRLQLSWYDTDAFGEIDADSVDGGTFLTHSTPYSDGDNVDGGDFSYDDTEDDIDGGTFSFGNYYSCYAPSSFSIGTDEITITGIRVVVDEDNEYAVGADGYVLMVSDNPLITATNMESIGQSLGTKIVGMKIRPFNISALSNPSVEAGDPIRITDRKGNSYDTFITNLTYKIGSYESFACNAETVEDNNATDYSAITKATSLARKEAEKQLTAYDKAVVSMNEIALNAMGYYSSYTTELDNSRISYIHDKPLREDSTIIYKFSASGFFLSRDGGSTWMNGFDANGNAVLNILYAIGISCKWIKGDTLTLGGESDVNGLLSVLNSSGIEKVRVDQNGITAKAGHIGSIKINDSGLGTAVLGQSLNGMWLNPSGEFGFSHHIGNSWTQLNYNMGSNVLGLWTAGANQGGGGMDISGGAPGDYGAGWVRWGWSDGQRSDGYYVTWYSGSDARLKKNVKQLPNDVVKLFFKGLRAVSFNYNKLSMADTSEIHFGVIAQEIEQLLESLGIEHSHILEEKSVVRKSEKLGKETADTYKYVNYHELHGFELAGIQDLYETVNCQQQEIDELKQQVKFLMEKVGG